MVAELESLRLFYGYRQEERISFIYLYVLFSDESVFVNISYVSAIQLRISDSSDISQITFFSELKRKTKNLVILKTKAFPELINE